MTDGKRDWKDVVEVVHREFASERSALEKAREEAEHWRSVALWLAGLLLGILIAVGLLIVFWEARQ